MRRILILRGGALGDFIVTLPALAALRSTHPSARIELAGNALAAAVAVSRGLLDAAHSQHESRWAALYVSAPLPPAPAPILEADETQVSQDVGSHELASPELASVFPGHSTDAS